MVARIPLNSDFSQVNVRADLVRDTDVGKVKRELLESVGLVPVTVVSTEHEFIAAVKCEATHILVEEHLDLRSWKLDAENSSFLAVPSTIKTIRVRFYLTSCPRMSLWTEASPL